jgi:hypothetical protein
MKTLTKVLLLAFWLLGAGVGWSSPDATPSPDDTPAAYHAALFDGVDLKVHRDRVTVQMASPWSGDRVAISAFVPRWVTALSSQVHAPPNARSATTAASEAPALETTRSYGS